MHPSELEKLFDAHSGALVLYARQWCAMPDDAVQEAFIDLANSPVEPVCPQSWLYTTTRRKAQNICRAEHRRRAHHRQAAKQTIANTSHATWFRPAASMQLLPEDVAVCLEALNGDEREIVVARVWGELNFEQLSELLSCSVSSAHRRYVAALNSLKALLEYEAQRDPPVSPGAASKPNPTARRNQHLGPSQQIAQLDVRSRLTDGEPR